MNIWTEGSTLSGAWQHSVRRAPDAPFLVFEGPDGNTRSWTYRDFDVVVGRAAQFLRSRAVEPGTSVHLALTNSPAFVALWLAATGLRAWIVPSDPMGAAPELAGHIDRTKPTVGFCAISRAAVYHAAASNVVGAADRMHIVEVDESDCDLGLFGDQPLQQWPVAHARDRAAVMFTSGTTGRPKGVEITQANYAFAGATMATAAGLTATSRQLVVLPLFHANAQYYSIASAIWEGSSVALMHTFSASAFLSQAARHEATHASLFAAPIRMILSRGATPVPGVRLQHCWYAMNISDDQYQTLSGLLGCAPQQLYGMTETIPAVLTDSPADTVPSSMGFVTKGCAVRVQRPDGTETGPNEVGEIAVGGIPGVTLFAGYLDDPETTTASFQDGWFLTGDRARRDVNRRFFFDGRRADVLKVAGENVSTVEVEQVLAAHPGVLEAAVIGRPDPVRDEVPVGFVVAADVAHPPTSQELHDWCAEHLTKSKRPRDITFVDELPRTSVGKIRKFLLRDPAAESKPHATPREVPKEVHV